MAESPTRKKATRAVSDAAEAVNPFSIADIKDLFKLMQANEIAELKLEQQETKIHIVSKGGHVPPPQVVPVMAAGMQPMSMVGLPQPASSPQMGIAQVAQGGGEAAAPQGEASAAVQAAGNLKTVFSPMVGTFYSSPSPEAGSFVRVGDAVNEESVLCIIEAMKLMNEIKAEMKGRVHKVLVENGVPVEYNQPLFLIEP